jgi:urease accessory protein
MLEPVDLGGGDPAAWAVLLNPSGGVLGGDHLVTDLVLAEGAHVGVTTPSATRVYRTTGPEAILDTRIAVGDGAFLEYFPDHLIPQAGSRLRQSLRIELAATARAIVWDALALGRPARNEWWSFASLVTSIDVTLAGRPAFVDRASLQGGLPGLSGLGGMEGFGYVATLVVIDSAFGDWAALSEELHGLVQAGPCRGGSGRLAGAGCFVRLLARAAHELADAQRALWACVRRRLLALPEVDLRKP